MVTVDDKQKNLATRLIQQYVDGWKTNQLELMIESLHDNCVVIESHGPMYSGLADIKKWFDTWIATKGVVTKWDILSYYYTEDNTVFFEWDFSCTAHNKHYALPGMSLVKFAEQKIILLHEYRMKCHAYPWNQPQLISE